MERARAIAYMETLVAPLTLQWPCEVPLSGDPPAVHQRIADYSAWLQVASLPKLFLDAELGVFVTGRVRKLACTRV
jgi:haloalkane dehalogenase